MYHYVYVVQNLVDNKIYVGKHSTDDLDDGYMGSGVILNRAIKKYGIDKFRKQILVLCASSEEAFELEGQIVNEQFVNDEQTYNLVVGGKGGGTFTPEARAKGRQTQLNDPELCERRRLAFICALKQRHAAGIQPILNWTGRRHTDATKRKIGDTNSVKQRGERNSQFGTCWIKQLSTGESKKIDQFELDQWEKLGWVRGRIVPSTRKKRS